MLINKKLTKRPEELEVPVPALPDNRVVITSIDLHYCIYVNSNIIYYQRPHYDDEEATSNQGDYQRLMSFSHIKPMELDLDRTDFESFKSQVLLQLVHTNYNLHKHFCSWKYDVLTSSLLLMILMDHPDASDDLVSLLCNVHDGGVQGFG
jgi:hypothetical protein